MRHLVSKIRCREIEEDTPKVNSGLHAHMHVSTDKERKEGSKKGGRKGGREKRKRTFQMCLYIGGSGRQGNP